MRKLHLLLIPILLASALAVAAPALAQQPEWCAPQPDGSASACVEVVLQPDTLLGDFYIAESLLVPQQNIGRLTLPAGTYTVDVRGITSSEPGWSSLFVYDNISTTLTVQAGQHQVVTLSPRRTYVRGTLDVTCDIRNYSGENVSCAVTIDTVPQPAPIAAGQVGSFVLDPGPHAVIVALAGDPAQIILWSPASLTRTVTVTASATPARYTATFNKAGHLLVSLDQPNVLGDFYIDGVLVATQVASIDQWIAPSVAHRLEVKNITDPAAAGVYRWRDTTQNVTLRPGETRTVTVRLVKQFLKGFLNVVCNITNAAQIPGAFCQISLNGVLQTPDLLAGQTANFTLDPGTYTIAVSTGPLGDPYADQTVTVTRTISAGRTTTYNATFRLVVPPDIVVQVAPGLEPRAAKYLAAIDMTQAYLASQVGGDIPQNVLPTYTFVFPAGFSPDGACCYADPRNRTATIYLEELESYGDGSQGFFSADAFFAQYAAHEYAHLWQFATGCLSDVPLWLTEGMAEYLSYSGLVAGGQMSAEGVDGFTYWLAGYAGGVPLEAYADPPEYLPYEVYALAYRATARVINGSGVGAVSARHYCIQRPGMNVPVATAFQSAFGISLADFYAQFESSRPIVAGDRTIFPVWPRK